MKNWPKISIVTCTYNGDRVMEDYFKLIFAQDYPKDKIEIQSDSMLAVKQINQHWKNNAWNLRALQRVVESKITKLIKIHWIPREINLAGVYLEGLKDR